MTHFKENEILYINSREIISLWLTSVELDSFKTEPLKKR